MVKGKKKSVVAGMGKEKFRQVKAFFGILHKKITLKDFIIINFQDTILRISATFMKTGRQTY